MCGARVQCYFRVCGHWRAYLMQISLILIKKGIDY